MADTFTRTSIRLLLTNQTTKTLSIMSLETLSQLWDSGPVRTHLSPEANRDICHEFIIRALSNISMLRSGSWKKYTKKVSWYDIRTLGCFLMKPNVHHQRKKPQDQPETGNNTISIKWELQTYSSSLLYLFIPRPMAGPGGSCCCDWVHNWSSGAWGRGRDLGFNVPLTLLNK